MVLWNPLLYRYVAEHPALLFLVSAHISKTIRTSRRCPAAAVFQQTPRGRWYTIRAVIHHALIPALLELAACAQTVVDKSQLGNLLPLLESPGDRLRCEVRTRAPVLDFSSRFRAELAVRIPLAQFEGGNHHLGLLVRLQTEGGGAKVYLSARSMCQARHPHLEKW